MLCDAAPAAAPTAPAGAQQQSGFGMMVPMLLILAIFYFMMIRPQQRKMIEELRAGAKIIFASGIIGEIIEAKEKTFTVQTSSGTEMEILRSCVQGVVTPEEPAAK